MNELVVVATGRRLALHTGLQPDAGGMFGYIIRRHRIPEDSEPGKHRVKARAHGGAAVVGVTDKMILMPQVQIPEDAMKEFGAHHSVEKIPVTGFKVNC
jgi:hypothetical protein